MTGTVLVTGGSRGIGAAIAKRAAASGFDIWLNFHSNAAAAESVKGEIEALGRACRLLPFDVGDEAAAEATLEPLLDEEVPFALVHNAGIARDNMAGLMTRREWDDVVDASLTGFFILSRLVTRRMLRERRGRIVGVGSVSGEMGQSGQMNYAAAKAGMVGAAKSLAREVGRRGITVNVVSPGLIETEMIEKLPLDQVLPLIPLGRVGAVEEVAGTVDFLLSDAAAYITGQVIGVNGGLHM